MGVNLGRKAPLQDAWSDMHRRSQVAQGMSWVCEDRGTSMEQLGLNVTAVMARYSVSTPLGMTRNTAIIASGWSKYKVRSPTIVCFTAAGRRCFTLDSEPQARHETSKKIQVHEHHDHQDHHDHHYHPSLRTDY